MMAANRILLGVCVGVCLDAYAHAASAQTMGEPKEDVRGREEYFWFQRSYPSMDRPYAQMERARSAAAQKQGRLSAFSAGVAGGWRSLGPNGVFDADNGFFSSGPMLDAGRVTAIATSPAGSLYIGTASGGVWQSAAGGYWAPLTDAQCNLSIGALGIDAADPNVLYAATGEYNTDSWGCGILRSTDGGVSWGQFGANSFKVTAGGQPAGSASFSKILVSRPAGGSVANTVLIGSTNVGIFRSIDGGSTWSFVLRGATGSLVAHPTQPSVVWAGNSDNFTTTARGVYKSVDNGATWTILPAMPGVIADNVARIEVAVTPAAPNVVYAAVAGTDSKLLGLFLWDDAAGTWTRLGAGGLYSGTNRGDFGAQAWYDLAMVIDPRSASRIYIAGVRGFKSDDGGATFSPMGMEIHVDWHSIVIDPRNPDILYAGTDGGVFVSTDNGNNWASRNAGLTITQYYPGISASPNGSQIMGGSQDNGTHVYTGSMYWNGFLGGDGGYTATNYSNPDIIYAESQWDMATGANLFRFDGTPPPNSPANPFTKRTSGIASGDRAAFMPPYVMDPVTPTKLYFGTHRLYRTLNEGTLWTAISGDLTKGSGYITTIAVSGIDPRTVYVGASDGMVNVTRDGGSTFTQSTTGLPNRYVTRIAIDPTDATHALLTASGFGTGHVFETRNAGVSWSDISAGLVDAPANAVVFVPGVGIMVGTDVGVFQAAAPGNNWVSGPVGIPNVVVQDLVYASGANLVLAGTYGRGMFAYTVGGDAAVLRGDANSDGKVDAFDALLIQQALVGSLPVSTVVYPRGDADCNFAIQSADAVYVLRTAVGLASPGVCVNTVK
ncbi:MAG: hypothetical protein JWL97_607 [Gemmatimonadales bacterium]|nr:hypothetical protein [Gemmatimonadales bacterium]